MLETDEILYLGCPLRPVCKYCNDQAFIHPGGCRLSVPLQTSRQYGVEGLKGAINSLSVPLQTSRQYGVEGLKGAIKCAPIVRLIAV